MAHIRLPKFVHLHAYHKTDGVHALYANIFLRQLAIYTFGLFVPLFILKLAQETYGASLLQGLAFVAAYYLAIRIVYLFLFLPLIKVIQLVGTRWSIFISNIFLLIFLAALSAAETRGEFLLVSILAAAIYLPLYWTSFSYLLTADSHDKQRGREVSKIGVLDRLGQIVGPLLGGLIVAQYGFGALFGASVVLVLFSSIPPFFMRHHNHDGAFELANVVDIVCGRKNRGVLASVGASAVRDITDGAFWPIFAFTILAGYAKLGFFYSLTGLLTIFMVWGVGWLYDKYSKTGLLKVGTFVIFVVWLGRALVSSVRNLYLLEGVKRMGNPVLWVAHSSLVYEWGRKRPLEYVVARIFVWQIAAVSWLFALMIAFWMGLGLQVVFALTAVVVLAHLLVLKK